MREVSSRNVVGQSVLWAFWLVLALAASGCGEGGSGTPTAPRASDTSNAQAASEAVPAITAVAPDPTTIPPTASRFIKISGRNFGAAQFSTSQVLFVRETGETLVADPVVSTSDWSSTQIRVLLLSSFTERERIGVAVRLRGGAIAGGFDSNVVNIQVERASEPVISGVQPQGAVTGQQVTITGASFGDAQLGTATVFFTSSAGSLVAAGQALLWSDSKIVVRLPFGAVSGPVIVARGAQQSNPQASGQAGLLIAADNTPPVLVSSSPTPNQTAVDPRTSITLVFSEAMGPGATSPANYLLTSSSGGSRTISPTTIAFVTPNSVRMDPVTPLEGGVLWTLSLSSASFLSRVADLAGNPLVNLSLAFRTANVPGIPGADQTAPILVSSSPADNSREVDVSSQLVLTFSEPVRFTGSPVSISSSAGDTPQLGTPLATNNNTVFVVRPAANLVGGATYTVSISNAFEDFAGNDFSGGIFRFTTREVPGLAGSDRTPPRLVSSNPSNGST
ncbi:MAG: Ig-like domain-containing protein, partial [Candidatus Wallbacteria bacterium]|nr:Ig-like domain-containing protein [Candidatus Wallbacteria bacterium]